MHRHPFVSNSTKGLFGRASLEVILRENLILRESDSLKGSDSMAKSDSLA
uniref:Uncharacterized protein n=1 Tax=Arundo donax TaxID=35708 RepID=A0A0A9H002_ARUDO